MSINSIVDDFLRDRHLLKNGDDLIPDDTFEVSEEEWQALQHAYRRDRVSLTSIPLRNDIVTKSVNLSRSMISWDLGAKFMKFQEEIGEFAEAALYETGYNQHKAPPKEDAFGEGSDVILCVIDILSQLYKDKTPGEIAALLDAALLTKFTKWEKRILEMERKTNDKSSQDQQLPSDDK